MKDFIELIHSESEQSNRFYNPEKSCDGGGYYQPRSWGLIRIGHAYLYYDYEDLSCGSFGTREYLTIISGGERYQFNFGSMYGDDFSIEEPSIRRFEDKPIGRKFHRTFGIAISEMRWIIRQIIDYDLNGYDYWYSTWAVND